MGRGADQILGGDVIATRTRAAARGRIQPTIRTAATDQIGDEFHATYQAHHPQTGEFLGQVEVGMWDGNGYPEAHIKHIHVEEAWRRQGVAEALLLHITSEDPDVRIHPGMMTEDGGKFFGRFAAEYPELMAPPSCSGCGRSDGRHDSWCPVAQRAEEDLDVHCWAPGDHVRHASGLTGVVGEWRTADEGGGLEIVTDEGDSVFIDDGQNHGFQRIALSDDIEDEAAKAGADPHTSTDVDANLDDEPYDLWDRIPKTVSDLPERGPYGGSAEIAGSHWFHAGGCAHLAIAFKTLYPELKLAAQWYNDHGSRSLSHVAAYDPATGRTFDVMGTDDVRVHPYGESALRDNDATPEELAAHMGIRYDPDTPWADDGIYEAAEFIAEHFGVVPPGPSR